ncbi:MAG: hypothetical protein JGK15_07150 [Microcoleus sp. PH2017_33_LGB_O_A]|nr:hypothetical protein [Microcoleus sp. PH2017_33_LGB_O_A]
MSRWSEMRRWSQIGRSPIGRRDWIGRWGLTGRSLLARRDWTGRSLLWRLGWIGRWGSIGRRRRSTCITVLWYQTRRISL